MLRAVLTLEQMLAMSPDAAAALWLVRQDVTQDTNDDALFQRWLEADAAHGVAWARACDVWENLRDADAADVEALKEADVPVRDWPRRGIAAAASVAFVVIASMVLMLSGLGSRFGLGGAPTQVAVNKPVAGKIVSTEGTRRTVTLQDGSVVILDADTALALAFDPAHRRIELLHGQAFFAVAHDPDRPLIVDHGKRSVTAVGTQFEMRGQGNSLRVILVEGRVRVVTGSGGADDVVELRAGQQLDAGPAGVTISRADLASVADRQQGMVSFHDTPLSDAVAELNRHARGKLLLVRDPKVAAIRISGAFHPDDPGRFGRTIVEIYPVRIVERANALELVSKAHARR